MFLLEPPIRKSELITVFSLRARIIQRALDLERAVATHLTVSGLATQFGQHPVSSMPFSLLAPHIRLACRLGDFVTNSREKCGLVR